MSMKPLRPMPARPGWGLAAWAAAVSAVLLVPYAVAAVLGLSIRYMAP